MLARRARYDTTPLRAAPAANGGRDRPAGGGELAAWADALRWQSAARPARLHLRSHARPAAQRDPHRLWGHGVERPPALVGSVRRHPALDVAGPPGLQHVRRRGASALSLAGGAVALRWAPVEAGVVRGNASRERYDHAVVVRHADAWEGRRDRDAIPPQ